MSAPCRGHRARHAPPHRGPRSAHYAVCPRGSVKTTRRWFSFASHGSVYFSHARPFPRGFVRHRGWGCLPVPAPPRPPVAFRGDSVSKPCHRPPPARPAARPPFPLAVGAPWGLLCLTLPCTLVCWWLEDRRSADASREPSDGGVSMSCVCNGGTLFVCSHCD